jgi:hypothetical protein
LNKNEQMKTYRVNERNLVSAPDEVVTLRFPRKTVECFVAEIPSTLKQEGLVASMPIEVTINGKKAGAFPCIIARSELSALSISAVVGYPVTQGDGVSFATQLAARKAFLRAREMGAKTEDTTFEWRLGSVTGPEPKQMLLSLPKQRTEADDLADSPF